MITAVIECGRPIPAKWGSSNAGRPRKYRFDSLKKGEAASFLITGSRQYFNRVAMSIRGCANYQLGAGNFATRTNGKIITVWRTK